MKSNLFEEEGEGIRLLSRRFISGLSVSDLVFRSKRNDRRMFELSIILSLSLFIVLFSGWRRIVTKPRMAQTSDLVFQVETIPQTEQSRPRPAPSRPTVPIASEDEEIPDEVTIDFTNIDFEDSPPPPPPPPEDDNLILFVPFDEPPVPIGGLSAVQKHLIYPEMGRLAGIQGVVVLHLQIDENGDVVNIRIIKSLGSGDFVEAASKAVRAVKWMPAKQRERPVKVWYSFPVEFTLGTRG